MVLGIRGEGAQISALLENLKHTATSPPRQQRALEGAPARLLPIPRLAPYGRIVEPDLRHIVTGSTIVVDAPPADLESDRQPLNPVSDAECHPD